MVNKLNYDVVLDIIDVSFPCKLQTQSIKTANIKKLLTLADTIAISKIEKS